MTEDTRQDAPGSAESWQGAGALIFNDLGQVLLIRQNYGGRYYALPGGVPPRVSRAPTTPVTGRANIPHTVHVTRLVTLRPQQDDVSRRYYSTHPVSGSGGNIHGDYDLALRHE